MPYQLLNKTRGSAIGTISDEDMQFLADQLEEESSQDTDYYLDPETVDFLARRGGNPALVDLLRRAVAGSEGIDITWLPIA